MRFDFPLISGLGVFHTFHNVSLERISFFEKLLNTFGGSSLNAGKSLQISCLPTGAGAQPAWLEHDRVHNLALAVDPLSLSSGSSGGGSSFRSSFF